MAGIILGMFSDRQNAEDAVDELQDYGYDTGDISIIMRDIDQKETPAKSAGAKITRGAVSGATTGAVVGGIAGLLGALLIPGIGGFLIGGPIAAAFGLTGAAASTLSGAATGAVTGGLLGGFMGLGLPEEEAREYESRIKEGDILIAVPVSEGNESYVREVLYGCNADRVRVIRQPKEYGDFPDRIRSPGMNNHHDEKDYSHSYFAGMKGGQVNKAKRASRTGKQREKGGKKHS